jgi:hypothetical protein
MPPAVSAIRGLARCVLGENAMLAARELLTGPLLKLLRGRGLREPILRIAHIRRRRERGQSLPGRPLSHLGLTFWPPPHLLPIGPAGDSVTGDRRMRPNLDWSPFVNTKRLESRGDLRFKTDKARRFRVGGGCMPLNPKRNPHRRSRQCVRSAPSRPPYSRALPGTRSGASWRRSRSGWIGSARW